jgi:hypothetical protein
MMRWHSLMEKIRSLDAEKVLKGAFFCVGGVLKTIDLIIEIHDRFGGPSA